MIALRRLSLSLSSNCSRRSEESTRSNKSICPLFSTSPRSLPGRVFSMHQREDSISLQENNHVQGILSNIAFSMKDAFFFRKQSRVFFASWGKAFIDQFCLFLRVYQRTTTDWDMWRIGRARTQVDVMEFVVCHRLPLFVTLLADELARCLSLSLSVCFVRSLLLYSILPLPLHQMKKKNRTYETIVPLIYSLSPLRQLLIGNSFLSTTTSTSVDDNLWSFL